MPCTAGKALNDQNLELAMKEMDKDGSGEVDFNEFYQWWTSETPKTLQMNLEVLDPAGTIRTHIRTHIRTTNARALTAVVPTRAIACIRKCVYSRTGAD